MTVTDKDMGWQALGERVESMSDGSAYVLVGIQGSEGDAEHRDDGLTNLALGTIHEFGLGVPRRSFIRDAIDQYQKELAETAFTLGRRVLLGEADPHGPISEAYALQILGQEAVRLIQQRITAHIDPPLSEYTKKKKGSDTPLVQYGTLRRSITYKLGGAA